MPGFIGDINHHNGQGAISLPYSTTIKFSKHMAAHNEPIRIPTGCGNIEVTGQELNTIFWDFDRLRDCFAVLVNPEVCRNSGDMAIKTPEQAKEVGMEILRKNGFSNDFINQLKG